MTMRSGGALLLAAAYAAAELGLGLLAGGYIARGRAEIMLFLVWRPWLLLVAGLLMAGWPPRDRVIGYVAALLLATMCEVLLALLSGGGANLIAESARGLLAGTLMAAVVEACFRVAAILGGKATRLLGFALAAGLLLAPPLQRAFDLVALPRAPAIERAEIAVGLVTGLPIVWGETPAAGPAQAYRRLADSFVLTTFDAITPAMLGGLDALVIAQPHALAPSELVAIDDWVRAGGRALLLSDPDLHWPGTGNGARGQALTPLIAHWGIGIEPGAHGIAIHDLPDRLATDSPGRFVRLPIGCAARGGGVIAACRIGRGRAILIADADLLHDRLWIGDGPLGATRLGRAADNGRIIVAAIDEMTGIGRDRAADTVSWASHSDSWRIAAAFLPALIMLMIGLGLARRKRR